MKRISPLFFIGIIITTLFFFYKTIFFGLVPFPGDLLAAEYQPWKSESLLGYVAGSIPNKAQYFDAICQMIPWKIFSWNALKSGVFPLWNPHNFSGIPHLANIQAALLYPLTYIGTIVPYQVAWSIIVIIQPLLAGLFMLLFMQSIGIVAYPAMVAAIAFAFSQFMTVFLEYSTIDHVIVWLPLSLFATGEFMRTQKKRYLGLLVASIVFSAFAGHLQLFVASSLFIFLYGFFRFFTSDKKRLFVPLIIAFLCSFGIAAIQLIPTIELSLYAARSSHEINFFLSHLLIQLKEWVLFLSPDAFGNPATRNFLLTSSYPSKALSIGLAPLVFAIGAVMYVKVKRAGHTFFISMVAILLILLTRNPISELLYRLPFSFITSSSPSNMQYLLSFSLAVLSGIGVNEWLNNEKQQKWSRLFFLVPFVLIGCVGIFFAFHIPSNIKNIVLTIGISMVLAIGIHFASSPKKKILFICLVICITIAERFYVFHKFNPFSPKELFYPPTTITTWLDKNAGIFRFWGYGHGAISSNIATGVGLYDVQGYDPLYPKRYGEFMGLSQQGKISTIFTNANRSNAYLSPGFGKTDLMTNPYRLRMLSLGGVKYILDPVENGSTEETFPFPRFEKILSVNGWNIMQNNDVTPRVFLTSEYVVMKTNAEFETMLMDKAFVPATTVLLEVDPHIPRVPTTSLGTVRIASYSPNNIVFETNTRAASLMVLTDTYYPGWTVTIDDKPAEILRADYTYRAVLVPVGNHTIVMRFYPPSWQTGIIVSISSILILVVLLFV